MTDQPDTTDLTQPSRHSGRIGQWSDRVKALALLVLLAVAGGILGMTTGGVGDAGTAREGIGHASSGQRASLPDLTGTVLAGHTEDRHPDQGDGGDPLPRALTPAGIVPPELARGDITRPRPHTVQPSTRAGHDSRMPTGPPARLSI